MARRRSLIFPSLVALAAFTVLIALGVWQMERKAWKDQLIETLTQRFSAAPSALPPPGEWAKLNQADDEFRRVSFRAEYLPGKEALVWAGGSALREDVKSPGVFVFTPARLMTGESVVISRGFVPDARPTGKTRRPAAVAGPVEVVGILRWPETPGWTLTTVYDRAAQLWFVRDHLAIARENGWGPVAPFYLERESQQPPDGLPSPGPFKPNLPNNHLQYALTWFGLATVLVFVFGFWAFGQWRGWGEDRT